MIAGFGDSCMLVPLEKNSGKNLAEGGLPFRAAAC